MANPGIEMSLIDLVVSSRPANVRLEDKAAWLKLEGPGGQRVYIAKQKTCRRIDLSDFGKDWVGTVPLKAPNGRVQAHLDLAHPHALTHLAMLLELIASMPKVEKEKTDRRPPAPKPLLVASSSPLRETIDEAKAQRLEHIAKIKKFASMKNVEVSAAILAEEAELLSAE